MHLMAATEGRLRNGGRKKSDSDEWETVHGSEPSVKPHGRLAWSMHLGHEGLYVDISVMPRTVDSPTSRKDI